MNCDNGCRVAGQGSLDHFPGVNRAAVDPAPEQAPKGDDPMAVVQEQAGEELMFQKGVSSVGSSDQIY